MQVTRLVKDDEKACRICEYFVITMSCWKNINNFGEFCKMFKRNKSIKKVVDFIDDL